MKKTTSLLAILVAGLISSHAETTITLADFETSSGYPAATNSVVSFVGSDGWTNVAGGGTNNARITPDAGGSGYTYVLAGSQSAMVSDIWVWQSFSSQSVTADDIANGEISWLQGTPGEMGANVWAGGFIGNSGGGTPTGIYGMRDNGGNYNIYLLGKNGSTNTGVTYQYGGGGTPTMDYVYQFSMTFDFGAHTMKGYYSLNGGSKNLLGEVDIASSLTAAEFATNYGMTLHGSVNTGIDNIQMIVVPEPTTLGLLMLGGAVVLLVRRKHKA